MLIDVVFLILMVLACCKGLRRGFIIAVFSIIGFIVGLAAALKLSAVVAARIAEHGGTGKWWPAVSFLLVFIALALIINICGRLIQKTFETVMLGWANRIAGALLYAIAYSIILSVFLFYAVQLHFVTAAATASSVTYPLLKQAGPKVIDSLGIIIPWFKNMFSSLQHFFENLSMQTNSL